MVTLPGDRRSKRLSFYGLNRYLMSQSCGALDLNHRSVFEVGAGDRIAVDPC